MQPVCSQLLWVNLAVDISQGRIRQSVELGIHSHIHCSHNTIFLPLVCLCLLSVKPDTRR